jgi:hypothetical protein
MIYVVRGSTGEYSDRTEWPVCAFDEQWKAERFVLQIETEIRKVESAGIEPYRMGTGAIHALLDQIRKFDPNARLDYTGLTYWVESVEVLDGIPIVHLDISKLVQDACDKENES